MALMWRYIMQHLQASLLLLMYLSIVAPLCHQTLDTQHAKQLSFLFTSLHCESSCMIAVDASAVHVAQASQGLTCCCHLKL